MTRPPLWFVVSTAALALTLLVLAVIETDMKAQYFIDEGEFVSLFGLAFVSVAGAWLARRRQLAPSLPLVFPWLLYPVVTQGDQIIDLLPINPMRAIVHVLLAAIFATPVAVVVLGLRTVLPSARSRRGTATWTLALLGVEMVVAYVYLGALMIVTLAILMAATLAWGMMPARPAGASRRVSERLATAVLVAGVVVSFGLYWGYKNRPGVYQGSPSFFMDPKQADKNYSLARVPVPPTPVRVPADPGLVRAGLDADALALDTLLAGYRILERNYTWDFHNHLFVRDRPLTPNYRAEGLARAREAVGLFSEANQVRLRARALLADDDPLAALLDELTGYGTFLFQRAPVLERMSAGFETTQAGLQHAAHLYEGEAKYLGDALGEIVAKHQRVLTDPALAPVTGTFLEKGRAMYEAYANHIVGF